MRNLGACPKFSALDLTEDMKTVLDLRKQSVHKINNFDKAWVENAQPGILISYKLFYIKSINIRLIP